ncbi:MAG: PKD domain-containing protein [Bacteroidales bacterium]|nr:PKD domain-containing protein [Bacteroidales bacterium]
MKKIVSLLTCTHLVAVIFMFFSFVANTQDYPVSSVRDNYRIDSLKIIPHSANTGDIISVVASTTHPSGGCDLEHYSIWKCNQFVFVDATYEQGMLTYICHSEDTIPLGTFSPGNYLLIYDWLDTVSFRVYPCQEDCQAYFTYIYAKCTDAKCINTVAFLDSSKGDVVTWLWDFGDGTGSDEQNPVHTYESSGIYEVCLTINTSDGCTSTYCEKVPVGPVNRCKADFRWEPLRCTDEVSRCCGSYKFTDLSKGNPDKWYWHFGDGDTSTLQNPVHTYPCNGKYIVSLVIVTPSGCSDIKLDTIVVGDTLYPCCKADFEWEELHPNWDCQKKSTNCITPYYYVQFTDRSRGRVRIYKWDFGDGTVSAEQNPFHRYKFSGTYNVCLTITCAGWCYDDICKTITVGDTVPGPCRADFTVSFDDLVCPTCIGCYCVRFVDQSSLNTVEWLWSFGDGDTSAVENPFHIYWWSPGDPLLNVCLRIKTSDHCTDSICKLYDPQSGSLVSLSDDISLSAEELTLFPNPVNDEIHILLPQEIQNRECRLAITDMYGRQIGVYSYHGGDTADGTISLNVANLDNGQYICMVNTDNVLYKSRFTVNK